MDNRTIKSVSDQHKKTSKCKFDFVECILERLPEMHINGYNYCGPNTNLQSKLTHSVPGINDLDCACKDHDIAYVKSKDLKSRIIADKKLVLKAIKRVYATDSQFSERIFALIISGLIGGKIFLTKTQLYINRLRNVFKRNV